MLLFYLVVVESREENLDWLNYVNGHVSKCLLLVVWIKQKDG